MNRWRKILLILFLYRCAMSVAGQTLVRKFTSLGDSNRWQEVGWVFEPGWWHSSNLITTNVGALIGQFVGGNKIFINMGFQMLAFYGIYCFVSALDPSLRKRAILLFFFPSFSIWSSVAGKEALLTFALGVICGYLIKTYSRSERLGPMLLPAIYLIAVMKPHYAPALLYIFGAARICRAFPHPGLLIFLASIATLLPLFYFRNVINALSFDILPHFLGAGRSTRAPFWVEPYDVFWKAPYGMIQGFLGPTLEEAMLAKNLLHVSAYVEGLVLIGILIYFGLENFKKLPIYNVIVIVFGSFWILFPNYPFGIMNPGSAVRYRTAYSILIILLVIVLGRPETYRRWRGWGNGRDPDRVDKPEAGRVSDDGPVIRKHASDLSANSNAKYNDDSGFSL